MAAVIISLQLDLQINGSNTVNSEIFVRILFSGIVVKDVFAMFKNSRCGPYLPISVNGRVILSFCEVLILPKLSTCENKTLAKVSEFTVPYHFCCSTKIYVMATQNDRLNEMGLLSTKTDF